MMNSIPHASSPSAMTEPLWTSAEAARATDGEIFGHWQATGVSIDSRDLCPGDLFIALRGDHHDGHDFVKDALAKGAAAAVVSQPMTGLGKPVLQVADGYKALDGLARYRRHRLAGHVTAITGSAGKTGAKDALHHIFNHRYSTHATKGNLNNQIGVPLTLARTPAATQRTILELGAGRPGDIAPLARLARPHTAAIISVSPAHAEYFSGLMDIALEKAAIFTGIAGGVAILPRDNPLFALLRDTALDHGAGQILSFGAHPEAQLRLLACHIDQNGTSVEATIEGRRLRYHLLALGRHWAINSLAVLAATIAAGDDPENAAEDLSRFSPRSGRGDCQQINLGDGAFTLIDESYNANPASMRAAIEVLGHIHPSSEGRRVAALGDMLELGSSAHRHHALLSDCLIHAEVDLVFTIGRNMHALYDALPPRLRGGHADTADHLAAKIAETVGAGDVVTVKGSRDSGMSLVVDALRIKGQNAMSHPAHPQSSHS